jgi:hypothetical protein
VLGFCGVAAAGGILVHSLWDFPLQKASILLYFLTLVADGWARLGVPEPDRERATLVQAD